MRGSSPNNILYGKTSSRDIKRAARPGKNSFEVFSSPTLKVGKPWQRVRRPRESFLIFGYDPDSHNYIIIEEEFLSRQRRTKDTLQYCEYLYCGIDLQQAVYIANARWQELLQTGSPSEGDNTELFWMNYKMKNDLHRLQGSRAISSICKCPFVEKELQQLVDLKLTAYQS